MSTTTPGTTGAAVIAGPDDLPANPFVSLRVAFGMLLGEQDFRTLMGQPRGKQRLHNAWLHGAGVVWGYRTAVHGTEVRVGPGLALDGAGRELQLRRELCLDAADWYEREAKEGRRPPAEYGDKGEATVRVHLRAAFRACLSGSVPALADPCEPQPARHTHSRVVETVALEFHPGPPPELPARFPRVRRLLGIEPDPVPPDPASKDVDASRAALAATHGERAPALLAEVRRLAAIDAAELEPAVCAAAPATVAPGGTGGCGCTGGPDGGDGGDCADAADGCSGLLPECEEHAGVTLAVLDLELGAAADCKDAVVDVTQIPWTHPTLLPTATIQDLVCGLAPGLLGRRAPDADGPRVDPESLTWLDERTFAFRFTRDVLRDTLVKGDRIHVSSLSLTGGGWDEEDVAGIEYDLGVPSGQRQVEVRLHGRPTYEEVRIVVCGTGVMPVTGTSGVPLAGRTDSPPGTDAEGRDAVLRTRRQP